MASLSIVATHSTRIVWTLVLCTSLALLGDATLYAVLPSQYARVGITVLQVGWLLSINRLARIPLNLVSGWLANHLGAKKPYWVGLFLGALSTTGYGLVRGFWPLLFLRVGWGIAWALLAVAAYSLVLDVSQEENRGRLMGTYATFSYLGGALGSILGGALVDSLGFPGAMRILGALTFLACLFALTLPSSPSVRVEPMPLHRKLQSFRQSFQLNTSSWLIVLLNFGHRFFFAGIFYSTFGLYLQRTIGDRLSLGGRIWGIASLTATLLFLRNVITVLTGPSLGYISDRLRSRSSILILGEILGITALITLGATSSLWGLGLGVLTAAMAYGIIPPMLLAWIGDLSDAGKRGGLVGSYQTMGDLGSGLGPLVAYALTNKLGISNVYLISGVALVLSIPLILLAKKQGAERNSPPPLDSPPSP
ncbi:MAG: MFS transporter [Anaerolineae bacterium]|nr:MFS transporter [Anaerolineae bacterium]